MTVANKSSFSAKQFRIGFPKGIENHYWNHARNRIVLKKLQPFVEENDIILDIGCGTGIIVDFLRQAGLNCYGCEIAEVSPVSESIVPFFYSRTDAFSLNGPIKEKCKVILLLDVLEHVENPDDFIRQCTAHFTGLKLILITLPARKELWSNYDEYYRHFCRYDLRDVQKLFDNTNLCLHKAGYFFHALYLPMRLLSLLGKERNTEIKPPRYRTVHRFLSSIISVEEALIPPFIPGSSLYLILKKEIKGVKSDPVRHSNKDW